MLRIILFTALLILPSSAFLKAAEKPDSIIGAGASFPYPIYSAWAYYYRQATGIKVNYQSIGSGGGVKQVEAGTVDFGASDDPLPPDQLQASNLIQFPAVLGGVVVVYNLEDIDNNELILTGKVMADIFHGKICRWNDPVIMSLNPGKNLPDKTINVIYRSDSSGTSAIFSKYLSDVSIEWRDAIGAGKSINWPVGVGAKGNDGVAGNIKRMRNSIGYVEYAYAAQTKIARARLMNVEGKVISPSLASFKAAAASVEWKRENSYYTWLINTKGHDSWPISAATFILVKRDRPGSIAKVKKFFNWCFSQGDNDAAALDYATLPENLKKDVSQYLERF